MSFIWIVWSTLYVYLCHHPHILATALCSSQLLSLIANEDYKNIYDHKGQTYDITASTSGLLVDVIKTVASICNFTLEIHLREDEISGKINEYPNGSLSYTGVFENLMDSKGIYSSLYQKMLKSFGLWPWMLIKTISFLTFPVILIIFSV